MKQIAYYLGFIKNEECGKDIEEDLFLNSWNIYHIMRIVICTCELLMLFLLCGKEGGPFATPRRTGYFFLYICLLIVTFLFTAADILWKLMKWKNYRTYMNLGFVYVLCIAVWACGVTLLDQLGGNGLTVYTYMMIMAAVLAVLKLWQSIIVFGGSFFLLNLLLPYFPTPTGADYTFNNLTNSLFITGIAIVISIYFNKCRIEGYKSRKIIERQCSELGKANERLSRENIMDSLTGLYNRRYLSDNISAKFCDVISRMENRPITCLMLDVDYFKKYNDTYGHVKGDECLIKVAEMVKGCFPAESAKVIRYGGEEFVVFIFNCSREQALVYAEDLQETMEKNCFVRNDVPQGYLTMSMGVYTQVPEKNAEMREFIRRADAALYEAKQSGRNCIKMYEEKVS